MVFMHTRKTLAMFGLFTVIVIAIMAPIASHDVVPQFGDYTYHLNNILAAHQAIIAGDFWPRTVVERWFYPIFQFYAPFTYILGGYVAFISHNPIDPFKFTIGLTLIVGAWYCYKLYVFLFRNEVAALLGAIVYLFSPYLLININVRGDFTEAVTQGLLPISLYYAFRLFYAETSKQNWYFFLTGILAFYILSISHLITFLYAIFFLFTLLFFLGLQQKKYWAFVRVFLCLICAFVLASWYLVPLIHYENLFYISRHDLTSPWNSIWLTQISTLLSPKGISPSALLSNLDFHLYCGFGLPITMSVLYWLYRLYVDRIKAPLPKTILWVWIFNFLILWSPTDLWKFLPHEFYVLQFTYRLLTDIMWLGGLLFVAALTDLFQQLDRRHLIVGIFAIAISGSGWMYSNYMNTSTPPSEPSPIPMSIPNNYILEDYLIEPSALSLQPHSAPTLPVTKLEKDCSQTTLSHCAVNITTLNTVIELPILYYPNLLKITVNGHQMPYFPSQVAANTVVAAVELPKGNYIIDSRFTGLSTANYISYTAWALYFIAIFIFLLFWRGKSSE